ncbi:putative cytochrome P450 513E1 [Frankliniella fusca]|uniref:Cytochrome P450 513E1 n=1 Tax=Frankliniella fusca TaxID=407009 RepID=A0AAE1GYC1_9NEOP|nr:putative cytochrome P450 513E1 [Frankliniella fusca]
MVDRVVYEQWASTDRCCLETTIKDTDDYLETLIEQLKKLLQHHFISKQQSKFFKEMKNNLKDGEDAVQSYYLKNDQVTIHPFVSYYKDESGEIKSLSFAVISDYMKHHINAVYAFQKEFISFIKSKVNNINKIIYFSDGAAQQYKNKFNALNLAYHKEDFGPDAEWHYFGTSHGKGPCDGLGGTLKRNAYLASLRKELIRNPAEFFEWCQRKMTGVATVYVTTQEVEAALIFLKERFSRAMALPNMRSQHALETICRSQIKAKHYSSSPDYQIVPVE